MNSDANGANSPPKSCIKPIDSDSIQHIAAGQKICDIETVVRELVENAIDANAKNVEVRLTRFGEDCIEVDDDGCGIEEEDFVHLAARYHTSKIKNYNSLQDNLETFGFRGEALHCICSVALVTITTKSKSSPTGTKLTFDKRGALVDKKPIARGNGTTITVKSLFHALPVRRRELESTAKRQYDKVARLLYEQALSRPHIKFSLCKKSGNKKDKDFLHGGTTLEGCIITIFGIKILNSVMPIRQAGLNGDSKVQIADESSITLKESDSLVEGSPKRTISVPTQNGESEIDLDLAMLNNFEPSIAPSRDEFFTTARKSRFKRQKPNYTIYGYISKPGLGRNSADSQFMFVNKKPCDIPKLTRAINETFKAFSNGQYPFFILFIQVQTWAADFNVPRKREVILRDEAALTEMVRDSLERMFSPVAPVVQRSNPSAFIPLVSMDKIAASPKAVTQNGDLNSTLSAPANHSTISVKPASASSARLGPDPVAGGQLKMSSTFDESDPSTKKAIAVEINELPGVSHNSMGSKVVPALNRRLSLDHLEVDSIQPAPKRICTERALTVYRPYKPPFMEINTKFKQLKISHQGKLNAIIEHFEELDTALDRERQQRKVETDSKKFSYAIHPTFNPVAEQELKLQIERESFKSMQVLGQFNNGFIITRLNKHLFIIDQHATDERANYEDQLKKSPLVAQPMVHPKPLYLNSIQENAVISNQEAFRSRGFEFVIDEKKMPGYKVMLKSTSICKGQGMDEHLDKSDVEELIDILTSAPNQVSSYTLKKVHQVAASRACRKSVMIGDKLSHSKMVEIVSKMSDLDNPWVCAHNRPTIRHLMDIDWMKT